MLGVSPEVDLLEEGHKLQGSREDGRLCLERLSQVVKTRSQETRYQVVMVTMRVGIKGVWGGHPKPCVSVPKKPTSCQH